MYDKRPERELIAVAQLSGTVTRHAGWKTNLDGRELADAVRELQEIIAGLANGPALMAEVAGVLTGARFGIPLEDDKAVLQARILVAAGADEWHIDGWACIGADRAAQAAQVPFGARLLTPGQQARRPRRQARASTPGDGFPA